MKVQLKLFATYRNYLPPAAEGSALEVQVPPNTRVSDLLRQFGLPENESRVVLINFYRLRGWDENGLPTPDKLRSLGLD